MKRFILLLLLLTCFRISYSEELNAEQKQLAWKFIIENLVTKEYAPTINNNRDFISINLVGETTSEDTLFVRGFIKNIPKNIRGLKIELLEKNNPAMSYDNHIIRFFNENKSRKDSLTPKQRKQFIYQQLFKGLVSFKKPKQDFPELNGSVFAEDDFRSITFSPFDFFILEKLYAPDFSIQLSRNLKAESQQTAWNSIRTKFLGETKKPIIYRDDIAIQLEGNVSQVDSAIMNELIDQFKLIIPNRKIFLTSEKENLVFNILAPESGIAVRSSYLKTGYSIKFKKFELSFPINTSKEDKKRTFYFYLMRSLIDFSPSKGNSSVISGSVFDENKPENITYTPIDAFILNTLYSDDFYEEFKNKFIRQFSYRLYLVHMYHNELESIFFLLALLISAIILTRLILTGAFKPHNWNWREYNKQGLYLIVTYGIYKLFTSASDLYIDFRILIILISFLQALLTVNLIFVAERFILSKQRNIGGSKVIVIFLITLVVLAITSQLYIGVNENLANSIIRIRVSDLSFLSIILFSLARSLYIFLNDRYRSIINQKDVELAKMSELHKHAELQSLRAKINPHFLYNALNSIASLATTDGRKTEQMALSLSDFFKYAINREQKQLNTLAEELNATRTYLEIEKVRFGDRLSFEIDCPDELLNIQIPQLLIQPLVENAIKHGLSQITHNGLIRITVSKSGSQLKIRVYDNGPPFPDGPLTGFGIQNTQERIALLYGKKATINWQNGAEKFIEICLPL